ncbi:phosphomannomutase/phosphoglucomutase [Corynebacterium kefirresidentii]|uniref:Phosphomannomutase/phosphoglucomutase n=1 Tax=Corynebacterium kefirresidentii TaxID=1979527 RepID=A0ABT8Q6L3_9CORY|nr:phosphomannomutase/phosphoglucomutase [Corynebacterium kefirresidentii]MCG7241540.1 phosphomannomutase/phosphoglucomutase [Corynebacterium kefirresidentii]MCG7283807.1 phosphomannomutase/phosphoglucomutase [Corynebacterium kefirresidentii]MCK6083288.1 phosphomannomutase/phosphoglucomutase [Corynebacterium kefirresidentii]MCT2188223.1 phosphomannomutase/phosphoglucomutase [Corynebacterium kefirresidentii]MDK8586690.1 phosphomannomutase/phosphoglucomutase [Corynebacterium kefirresidentii]
MRTREQLDAVIKAYDVRGVVGEDIDENFVRDTGAAFAAILREEGENTVAVGHDMRPSSPSLARAFAEGVTSQGLNVTLLGLTSTDELYYAAGSLECAGAMFTASHNPAKYNGIKLCRAGAVPVGQETGLGQIKQMLIEGTPEYTGTEGAIAEQEILAGYADFLRKLVPLEDSKPLVVAVDAANGMGGHTVPAVFDGLPFEVRDLYFELDGTFPNHEANPLDPKNLVDLQKFTVEQKADIGLAFDGDADRCFVVDEKGQPVSPSAICALVAGRYLDKFPGATIIHNLITSKTVPELIKEKGGTPVRTRVGHSFIKAQMAEHKAAFGGEHSAHYYFQEFWNADSGMLAAMHVLAALGQSDKPLSELMAEYSRYEASGEINSTVEDQKAATQAVLDELADKIESVDELDGVTVELKGTEAWFNVRASNTEPLLRLNVEAKTADEVQAIVDEVLAIIRR